jgi:hypothetical protein
LARHFRSQADRVDIHMTAALPDITNPVNPRWPPTSRRASRP